MDVMSNLVNTSHVECNIGCGVWVWFWPHFDVSTEFQKKVII